MFEDFSKEEIENFHREIAKNIATIRKEKGFSQLDLSLAIGYKSVSLVGGAEAGYKNIHYNLEHLYKIAKVLEVEIGDFLKGFKTIPKSPFFINFLINIIALYFAPQHFIRKHFNKISLFYFCAFFAK